MPGIAIHVQPMPASPGFKPGTSTVDLLEVLKQSDDGDAQVADVLGNGIAIGVVDEQRDEYQPKRSTVHM